MSRTQFRVLYRQFLFRLVDLDLLASRADLTRLLWQFGALLVAFSLMMSGGAVRYLHADLKPAEALAGAWTVQHFLLSTTMLVVGLLSVLSWDSMFPDRRDVMVLAPLPVRTGTVFLAKGAALGTMLGLAVLAVNLFSGLAWPFALSYASGSLWAGLRAFAGYWFAMLASGAFLLCSVLAAEGAASLLPRRHFLRVSSALQLAAFCLFLTTYCLQPSITTPAALTSPRNQAMLALLPSHWFLALMQDVMGAGHAAFGRLAERAWTALALSVTAAAAAFLLSCLRTVKKIAEEPDIVPASRRRSLTPRFADPFHQAVLLFSIRTLFRSRQHRVLLAFYLGAGLAIAMAYSRSAILAGPERLWGKVSAAPAVSSVVLLFFAVMGVRAVFSLPLELQANWIFRVTAVREPRAYLSGIRAALIALSAAPVWAASALLFLALWPPWSAAGHLAVLALLAVILVDVRLHGFRKIPFTCAYLPGKSNIHVTSGAYAIAVMMLAEMGVDAELRLMRSVPGFAGMAAVLGGLACWFFRRTAEQAQSPETALEFDDAPAKEIYALELHRDGVLPR